MTKTSTGRSGESAYPLAIKEIEFVLKTSPQRKRQAQGLHWWPLAEGQWRNDANLTQTLQETEEEAIPPTHFMGLAQTCQRHHKKWNSRPVSPVSTNTNIVGRMCARSSSRVWLSAAPWTVAPSLLCPQDSLGKNTGVGSHFQLQGIFSTQRLNLSLLQLLHWQAGFFFHHWATGLASKYQQIEFSST